jgi:hypothetical protein
VWEAFSEVSRRKHFVLAYKESESLSLSSIKKESPRKNSRAGIRKNI